MQLAGYPQGAGNTGRGLGPSAGSFPGEGSTGLGASLGLVVAAATEAAQKMIFPNYLHFRNEKWDGESRKKKR